MRPTIVVCPTGLAVMVRMTAGIILMRRKRTVKCATALETLPARIDVAFRFAGCVTLMTTVVIIRMRLLNCAVSCVYF